MSKEEESEWGEVEPEETEEPEEQEITGSFIQESEEPTPQPPILKPLDKCTEKEILVIMAYNLQRIADDNHEWRKFLMREGQTRKYQQLNNTELEPWSNVELAKKMFPAKYLPHMSFQLEPDKMIISILKYMDKEDFAKIAGIVRDAGGEYVSAGKNSHFELPRP